MNILFFYRIFPNFGGVETITTVLANKFVADGHHVTIASIEQPHMELHEQLDPSIDIIKLEYPVYSKKNIEVLREILKSKSIEYIINQWGLPFATTKLCNAAKHGLNIHLVSVLHGAPNTSKVLISAQDKIAQARNPLCKLLYKGIFWAKQLVIKHSIRYCVSHNERYILLSNSFIKPLIDYSGTKKTDNIVAIGNPVTIPVNLDGFSLAQKKKQILYAGRMDYENKRVNRILSAWQEIADHYPDWELVLVGEGPHKAELVKTANFENIQNVKFFSFQVEPPISFYKDASIYMQTSDLEGFGLAIVESMSFGVVPIVYGSYEAAYDIIDNGESGFVTEKPFSQAATVQCLRTLIENPEKRKKMALTAMQKAKNFSLDTVILQWYNLLKSL